MQDRCTAGPGQVEHESPNQKGGRVAMKSANRGRCLPAGDRGWMRWGWPAALLASAIFVASLAAQTPSHPANAEQAGAAPGSSGPNYALEARFLPESVNKLVFDLSLTPHWFTLSDRF